jgi:hypothetical protein
MQELTADREGAIVAVMGTHLLSRRFETFQSVYARSLFPLSKHCQAEMKKTNVSSESDHLKG